MRNLIVKHPKCSAGVWFGVIEWRKYMSAAKIHKRMQIWAIFLLIITTVNGCEIDTKPIVSGGNPPIIEFEGTGALAQLFMRGPYTLEQLKQEYKIAGGKNELTPEEKK